MALVSTQREERPTSPGSDLVCDILACPQTWQQGLLGGSESTKLEAGFFTVNSVGGGVQFKSRWGSKQGNHGINMGGCQNHGPLNTRCRTILKTQQGTVILTTTRIARLLRLLLVAIPGLQIGS